MTAHASLIHKTRPSPLRHLPPHCRRSNNKIKYLPAPLFPKITWRLLYPLQGRGDAALRHPPHILRSLLFAPPYRPLTINSSCSMLRGELAESFRVTKSERRVNLELLSGREGNALDEWKCFRGKVNDFPSANWLYWPFPAHIHTDPRMHTEH